MKHLVRYFIQKGTDSSKADIADDEEVALKTRDTVTGAPSNYMSGL